MIPEEPFPGGFLQFSLGLAAGSLGNLSVSRRLLTVRLSLRSVLDCGKSFRLGLLSFLFDFS